MQQLQKQSGSGITVEGQTLEEYLDAEAEKEKDKDAQQTQDEELGKHTLYKKPHDQVVGKGRSDRTQVLSVGEINQQHWERNLKAMAESKASLLQLVIGSLAEGSWQSASIVWERIEKHVSAKSKPSAVSNAFTNIKRSELGHLLEKRRIQSGKARSGSEYRLAHCAVVNMKVTEMFRLYSKREKDYTIAEVVAQYADIANYLKKKISKTKEAPTVEPAGTGPEPDITVDESGNGEGRPERAPILMQDQVMEQVAEEIRKAFGVDVTVKGRIDVVFQIGIPHEHTGT